MTQLNSPENTKPTAPPEAQPHKEPEHVLSNSVWESLKQDYVKPAAWVEGNVLAPLYNEALRPINTVIDKAQILHVPVSKLENAEVPDAPINSAAFYVQNTISAGANFGMQLVAAHFAGKAWRNAGEAVARETERANFGIGTATSVRNFASSKMLHNVTGAVGYAAFLDPENGQTRTSNALVAGEGMLLYHGANKLVGTDKVFDARAIALRAATGAPIGASQQFLNTLLTTGQADTDISHYSKGMAAGAFMNVVMPGMAKGMEAVAPKLGVSAYADNFAEQQHQRALAALKPGEKAEPGSWADPRVARLAVDAGKIDITMKARSSDIEETSINHMKQMVTLKKGDSPSQFIEENVHSKLARDPEFEKGFLRAGELAKNNKPEEAQQEYIRTRVAQEVAAHKARFEAIQKSGAAFETTSINPADIAKEYAAKFLDEAKQFISSKGEYRPAMSFSHGGGGGGLGHGTEFVQNVGIAPTPGHDGAPHAIGDTGATSRGVEQTAGHNTEASAARLAILDTLPEGAKNVNKDEKGKPLPGFKYGWPDAPQGVSWLGHDNVKTVAWDDDHLGVVKLTKIDPNTKQVASVVDNFDKPQRYPNKEDGSDAFFFKEVEQNQHTAQQSYKVEEPGSWNLPKGSTWEVFPRGITLELGGLPVKIDNIVRYNDEVGRIDYVVPGAKSKVTEYLKPRPQGEYDEEINPATGKPEFNFKPEQELETDEEGRPYLWLYQRSLTRDDGSLTKYISDPRKYSQSFPREKLIPDGSVDSAVTGKPLSTSLGDFEHVYRFSDMLRYENDEQIKAVHFESNRLRVTNWNRNEATTSDSYVDSIKENYPGGRDTQWGRADAITVKPKSMLVELSNGGSVEIFNSQAFPDGAPYEKLNANGTVDDRFANNRFGNVRRVDTTVVKHADGSTSPGEIALIRELSTPEGRQYSTVIVPPRPVSMNSIEGLDRELPNFSVDAYEILPGQENGRKFYLTDLIKNGERVPIGTMEMKRDGFQTDSILKNGPYNAVWRYPGGVAFMNNVQNNASLWNKAEITFQNERTNNSVPTLSTTDDLFDQPNANNSRQFSSTDLVKPDGGNRPVVTEYYPKGHATKWGVALNRETYANGMATMTMRDGTSIAVDANENYLSRTVFYANGTSTPWGLAYNRETFNDGSAKMAMGEGKTVIVDAQNNLLEVR